MSHIQERNQEATVYVGDLDAQVNEALVWELFLQAGPVVNVHIPKDKLTQQHMGYGFVEFNLEEDAEYALKVMNMIKLFGKPIKVNKASRDKKVMEVGANLFIGNLDPDVDEKLLYDTFGAFGVIISTPKIMRDPETGVSKGFGFVNYDNFESSDVAIEAMNQQYLCNRPIHVSYALKKDTKGERHGSQAERLLAAANPNRGVPAIRPHNLFANPAAGAPPAGIAAPMAAQAPAAHPPNPMLPPPHLAGLPPPHFGLPPHLMGLAGFGAPPPGMPGMPFPPHQFPPPPFPGQGHPQFPQGAPPPFQGMPPPGFGRGGPPPPFGGPPMPGMRPPFMPFPPGMGFPPPGMPPPPGAPPGHPGPPGPPQ